MRFHASSPLRAGRRFGCCCDCCCLASFCFGAAAVSVLFSSAAVCCCCSASILQSSSILAGREWQRRICAQRIESCERVHLFCFSTPRVRSSRLWLCDAVALEGGAQRRDRQSRDTGTGKGSDTVEQHAAKPWPHASARKPTRGVRSTQQCVFDVSRQVPAGSNRYGCTSANDSSTRTSAIERSISRIFQR